MIPATLNVTALESRTDLNRSGDLDQRFALDVQGVSDLRRQAQTDAGIKQVARQFEAMFLQMVLKSMRDASTSMSDGMFDSHQEKMYTSMLDQQLSQHLSGRGLGLAEAMEAQLRRGASAPPIKNDVRAMSERALQNALPDLSIYTDHRDSEHVQQFIQKMAAPAAAASGRSGIPAELILAQAALESGWGRKEIKHADGRNSHNIFGIKADKSWKGKVVESVTTEYVDGIAQSVRDNFRAYDSYQTAFVDYVQFLQKNPRYRAVLSAENAVQAAHGLQQAGYATDPQYANKLTKIMQKISG